MADNNIINNTESNKDFILLSTNLNAYKSDDDNKTNDKNLLFSKKEFERNDNSVVFDATIKQIEYINDFNRSIGTVPNKELFVENYKPIQHSYQTGYQIPVTNTNRAGLSYDWSVQNQQYSYYPIPNSQCINQDFHQNSTKLINNNNLSNDYCASNQSTQNYQAQFYENEFYRANQSVTTRNPNQTTYNLTNNYNPNYFGSNSYEESVKPISSYQTNQLQSNQSYYQYYKDRSNQLNSQNYSQTPIDYNQYQTSSQYDLNHTAFYVNKSPTLSNDNLVKNETNIEVQTIYSNADCNTQHSLAFNRINSNKSIVINKNNSLQSPSSSSPSSATCSSSNIENQEMESSDEDDDEDDDDEDEDDEANKSKQAPWIQPGLCLLKKNFLGK